MRPWQERLRPASFRGVAFRVFGHEASGGQRGQLHQYPQRDVPFFEGLGRRAERFSVDGYIVGADYQPDRDRLLSALQRPGAGVLIHPWLGTRNVYCVDWNLRERTRDGGMAIFRMAFTEAGENRAPSAGRDTAALVDGAGSDVLVADEAAVEAGLEPLASAAQWVLGEVSERISSISSAILEAADRVRAASDIGSFVRSVGTISDQADTLVSSPDSLATQVHGVLAELREFAAEPEGAVDGLLSLTGFAAGESALAGTTSNRRAAARADEVVVGLVRRGALAEAARASTEVRLDSLDAANALRDRLLVEIDAQAEIAAAEELDAVYSALRELARGVSSDITARGATLARLVDIDVPGTVSALQLAFRLYGDAGRAQEIVDRNRIPHPGFVPGGARIEVLSA